MKNKIELTAEIKYKLLRNISHKIQGTLDLDKILNLLPTEYKLEQNYPNPFNPSTIISYQLPVAGEVSLKVYDVLGGEVITLVNEYRNAGNYEVEFNVAQESLPAMASGIYFYQLKAGNYIKTMKMIIAK